MTSVRGDSGRLVVLDTNVVSELMRSAPDERVRAWVLAQPPALIYTTAVTLAEIRYGIARLPAGRRRRALAAIAGEVFEAFNDRVLPFTAACTSFYADTVAKRLKAGAPISGFDAQIAAICLVHDAILATRNVSDFNRVGLELVDPWTFR